MQGDPNQIIVLLYWEKSTWYSLGSLAASLQKNQLAFKIIKSDPIRQIQEELDKKSFVIYGESSRNMSLDSLKERLRKIKAQISSDRLFIIVGGPQASGDPQLILNMGADIVVIGEGEVTLPELVLNIKKIKNIQKVQNKERLDSISGIAYNNTSGELIKEQTRSPIVLDNYCPYSDNNSFP
ncbi:MAG: cobalamin-dependent protein, partial [Candidatus Hodarchaeales archaeon]